MLEELDEPFLKSRDPEQKVAFKSQKRVSLGFSENFSKPGVSSSSSKTSRRLSRAKRSPERTEFRGKKSFPLKFEPTVLKLQVVHLRSKWDRALTSYR